MRRMDDPLAYFLTWTTYGTWLPGDERGWYDYHQGLQLADLQCWFEAAERMTDEAVRLDASQRAVVEATITRHCQIRGWKLHAVNARSNHVHVVLTSEKHPDDVREQFKAWCTRQLKQNDRSGRTDDDGDRARAREGLS